MYRFWKMLKTEEREESKQGPHLYWQPDRDARAARGREEASLQPEAWP